MNLKNWPNCKITGCKNKSCLRLNSIYCYPHTMSNQSPEQIIADMEGKKKRKRLKAVKVGTSNPGRLTVKAIDLIHNPEGYKKLIGVFHQ
jgi:hypothetical protein